MTDFYALLKQSIIERDIRDADDREAVYVQARQAIVKQLWAFHPPLAADEIDARVGAYDQAVERIERDLQAAFAEATRPVRERPTRTLAPPPEPDPPPEPEYEEEIAAPPLAEWRHDGGDMLTDGHDDDEDYERGVPRASALARTNGHAGAAERPAAYARRREEHDTDETAGDDGARDDRWSDDGIEPAGGGWWPNFSERETIQILAGAIAALVIALVAIAAWFYFSGSGGDAASVNIDVRREVSDSATAARIASDPIEVVQSYTLFDGRDPTIFASTPDNPVRFVSEGGGYARVASSASAPGVRAIVGPGLAARLAGKRVRVTLVARSSTDFGASSMRFAYQSGLAISHWQTANLSAGYEAVGMIWRIPTMRTDPNGDYLVIEPGIPGDGTGADIQAIRIDVLAGES